MTHLGHRKLVEGTYSCISHGIDVGRTQKYSDGNKWQLQHHIEIKVGCKVELGETGIATSEEISLLIFQ